MTGGTGRRSETLHGPSEDPFLHLLPGLALLAFPVAPSKAETKSCASSARNLAKPVSTRQDRKGWL